MATSGELVTPLALELAAGEYDLTMENGGLTPPLTERVRVSAGRPNVFRFTMPGFSPAKVAQELRGGEVQP